MARTIVFLGLAGLMLLSQSSHGQQVDCDALLAEHLKTDLSLDYESFDQTMDRGFRVLAGARCPAQAADLIEAYIEANNATENSLGWHVAQLRATAGNYPEAIKYARRSLREDENWSENALRWNDYVLATIAFLEHDREALIAHRDVVAAGSEAHFGNALNAKLLDALIRHFEQSYAYATEHIEP